MTFLWLDSPSQCIGLNLMPWACKCDLATLEPRWQRKRPSLAGFIMHPNVLAGLRDLVDFCPASLAAIVSYFSAEIARGVWKLVPMNGIDWPSPAQILPKVESDMKGVLAAAGVNFPSYPSGKLLCLIV